MELIRGIHNIRARHHGCVLTIGNFDGVHRGHQALLEQLKQQGKRLGLPVMVMILSRSRWRCSPQTRRRPA